MKWNQKKYNQYLKNLKSLGEEEYAKFQKKLTPTKYPMIGIRLPIQRKIAKEIGKSDVLSFLSFGNDIYFEEVNIKGMVIASLKEKEIFDLYFEPFLSKIDNWAICDSVCSTAKIVGKNLDYYFPKIQKWILSTETYTVRVSLVLLLHYYMKEEYIPKILNLVQNIHREEYYIQMAASWLLAECYIEYPNLTFPLIQAKTLDTVIQNKTISKIRDSYRVSPSDKELLREYKK